MHNDKRLKTVFICPKRISTALINDVGVERADKSESTAIFY